MFTRTPIAYIGSFDDLTDNDCLKLLPEDDKIEKGDCLPTKTESDISMLPNDESQSKLDTNVLSTGLLSETNKHVSEETNSEMLISEDEDEDETLPESNISAGQSPIANIPSNVDQIEECSSNENCKFDNVKSDVNESLKNLDPESTTKLSEEENMCLSDGNDSNSESNREINAGSTIQSSSDTESQKQFVDNLVKVSDSSIDINNAENSDGSTKSNDSLVPKILSEPSLSFENDSENSQICSINEVNKPLESGSSNVSVDSDKENAIPDDEKIDNSKENLGPLDVDGNENSFDGDAQAPCSDIRIEFTSTCETDTYFNSFSSSGNVPNVQDSSQNPDKSETDSEITDKTGDKDTNIQESSETDISPNCNEPKVGVPEEEQMSLEEEENRAPAHNENSALTHSQTAQGTESEFSAEVVSIDTINKLF